MKKNNLIAKATTTINALRSDIWDALTTPESIKQYMFGTDVTSKFYEGSPIVWRGEWQAKVYADKSKILLTGIIDLVLQQPDALTYHRVWEWTDREELEGKVMKVDPGRVFQFSHYSPLSGLPDRPDNYHIVTIELIDKGGEVKVVLTQDKNLTEEARQHYEKNWQMVLDALKQLVEG